MKRLVLGLLLVLLVVGALLFVDSLTKQAIERGGSHALGVATRLQDADIGLFSGEFRLEGLAVANPPGFARPDFLELRSARLELPLASLLEPRVTIHALELQGIVLDLERNARGTNYGVILESLSRFGSGSAAPEDEPPAGEGGKTYRVEKLTIRDVRAVVQLVPAGGALTQLDFAVPEIVVEDLASDMSLAQLCARIVEVVIQAALQAGEGIAPDEILADLRGRVDALGGVARGRLEEALEGNLRGPAKKLGPGSEKALEQAGDELGKKLDGLLKQKD